MSHTAASRARWFHRPAARWVDLATLIMRERAEQVMGQHRQEHAMMRRVVMMGALMAGLAGAAQAQTATPASRLAWDQVAGSVAEASSYTYEAVYDGAAAAAVAGVTCAGTASPYQCAGSFPALTPGAHTVALQARNAAGASPLSAVFNFAFVALPSAPQNLRIVTGA